MDYIGEWTNIYGSGSNWGGKNRSGGNSSYKTDIFGEYPLGDPSIKPNSLKDKFYRRHDIQCFVDAHYKKDDIVNVGSYEKPEYFKSNGYSFWIFNKPNSELIKNEIDYLDTKKRLIQSVTDYGGMKTLPKGYSQSEVRMLDRNNPANWTTDRVPWGPQSWIWQALHEDWLDRDYAKKFYAEREMNTKSNAMSWVWGSVGGFIPGEGKSIKQKYISDMWDYVPVINTARTFVSSLLNSKEGKINESMNDLSSLVIGYIEDVKNIDRLSKSIIKSHLHKYISNQTLQNTNRALNLGEKVIDKLGKVEQINNAYLKLKSYNLKYQDIKPFVDELMGIINIFEVKEAYGDEITPSNVGGVYLGGAGQALEGLGQVEGLTMDENNNLVLITKKGDQVNLPSLRLDDVVTVFRSVYLYGEGPTVTIDPNPADPENSAMIIKHGQASDSTFTGFILYASDRIMKTYMLGVDNITTKDVVSKVPGYQDVLNSVYFGNGILNNSSHQGKWERFWIVPATVNQYNAKNNELTLFDVPLKVKTQVMKWENGDLVDDSLGQSSFGASKFAEWFTKEYDEIGKEQYILPPAGFGIKDTVPVFTELRRIAVITAIAEKMRDQGVAMPFWMRDFEVKKVAFEKYTPAMEITRSDGTIVSRIFGGVSLSTDRKDVKQFSNITDVQQLPLDKRVEGEKILERATKLSEVIAESGPKTASLEKSTYNIENESFQALSLPGCETKALSPNRQSETDLTIYTVGGNQICLSRQFNSFFNPKDSWGRGWTMDLPRLEKVKIPVETTGNRTTYKTAFELISPLNSLYVKFSDVKEVPMLKSSLQVPDQDCDFFGLANSNPDFLNTPTTELIGKTGESWHFTEEGDLIAIEKDGFKTIYLRNQHGKVKQIVGLHGKYKVASIELEYNDLQQLISAKGIDESNEEQAVQYEYDQEGRLTGVVSDLGRIGYKYKDYWVTEVNWQNIAVSGDEKSETILHRFEYNDKGQLIAEYNENDPRMEYLVTTDQGKTSLKMNNPEDHSGLISVSYDPSYRPVESKYKDGSQLKWIYPKSGGSCVELTESDGKKTTITQSPDKTKRSIESAGQPTVTGSYDEAGRLINLAVDDKTLYQQQWSPYGKLELLKTVNCVFQPQYDQDGLTKSMILSPPGSGNELKVWQSVDFDLEGRPASIKDYTGLENAINYNEKGEVSQFITVRNGTNYGYGFNRNDKGQIESIESSWGKEQGIYDPDGSLSKLVISRPGSQKEEQAVAEFADGSLKSFTQFDGGQTQITYNNEGLSLDLPSQIICPNGLGINYSYNPSGNLDAVHLGENRQVKIEYDVEGRIVGYSLVKL